MENENSWLICLKTKQTAKSISFAFGYTFKNLIKNLFKAECCIRKRKLSISLQMF